MRTKKKGHDWVNLINHDSSLNRGLHAPGMVVRSALEHHHDKKPKHSHMRGWHHEMGKERLKLGDLQEGHSHKHLDKGYRTEPMY